MFYCWYRKSKSANQKLIINDCHEIFDPYLKQLHSTKYCNIELRPRGIGLRFRYKLEAIGWFIPYTALDYHHEDYSLKIQDQLTGFFMNLKASHRNRINLKFMNKMRQLAGWIWAFLYSFWRIRIFLGLFLSLVHVRATLDFRTRIFLCWYLSRVIFYKMTKLQG